MVSSQLTFALPDGLTCVLFSAATSCANVMETRNVQLHNSTTSLRSQVVPCFTFCFNVTAVTSVIAVLRCDLRNYNNKTNELVSLVQIC